MPSLADGSGLPREPAQFKSMLEASKNVLKLNEAMSIVKKTHKTRMAPGNPIKMDLES